MSRIAPERPSTCASALCGLPRGSGWSSLVWSSTCRRWASAPPAARASSTSHPRDGPSLTAAAWVPAFVSIMCRASSAPAAATDAAVAALRAENGNGARPRPRTPKLGNSRFGKLNRKAAAGPDGSGLRFPLSKARRDRRRQSGIPPEGLACDEHKQPRGRAEQPGKAVIFAETCTKASITGNTSQQFTWPSSGHALCRTSPPEAERGAGVRSTEGDQT